MRLAIFNDFRLGVVNAEGTALVDVSDALGEPLPRDPFGAGWWVRLCRDFTARRPGLEAAARTGPPLPLASVQLRASALNPTKVVAAAANYAAHVAEMRDVVLTRVSGSVDMTALQFDIFLKAPSAIVGPSERVVLPQGALVDGKEIHHESELALVIGKRATRVARADAFDYILGYTIGIDVTVRGEGDRTRRKSYDSFCPLGPWLTTADEIADPNAMQIELSIGGSVRQHVRAGDMLVDIPGLIEYASAAMTLEPGDVLLTGAPPGVGQIHAGEIMHTTISGIGTMDIAVAGSPAVAGSSS